MRAVYTFIAEEQATPTNTEDPWSVAEMCRARKVSRSGYYDWVDRAPSEREATDRCLEVEIEASRALYCHTACPWSPPGCTSRTSRSLTSGWLG